MRAKAGKVVLEDKLAQLEVVLQKPLLLADTDIGYAYLGFPAADFHLVLVGHLYDREVFTIGHAKDFKNDKITIGGLLILKYLQALSLVVHFVRVESAAQFALRLLENVVALEI